MSKKHKDNKTSNGTNKNIFIIIIIFLIGILALIFIVGSKTDSGGSTSAQNVEIKDGVQYITIKAGGGYTPKVSSAKAGIPTKLIMKTNGIFDCSASLVIRSVGFQKVLPQTGETEIDIGTPVSGEPLQGVCGMGMYSFIINFT